jgi:hypothetical protein
MTRRAHRLLPALVVVACLPVAGAAAEDGGVCAGCPPSGGGEAEEQLDLRELRSLARGVGFRKPKLAAAIAMAESGGLVRAKNRNRRPRSVDRGLFQINSHWHPEVSRACAYDALCNARAALEISGGGRDWSEWNTYRNRSYRLYL